MDMRVDTAALKPTILIVEDDEAVRHSLSLVLGLYGFTVEEFASGEALLAGRVCQAIENCCVVLDVNLPGASGLEVLRQLRAMGVAAPVVLVTGQVTPQLREQARPLQPLAFLEKPVDIDRLVQAIGSIRV